MPYTRKTRDEFEVQGRYGERYGYEAVYTATTRAEAREQLKCYRENEPQYAHRIVKKRVKIAA